jgi:hypothetical protein
LPNYVKKHAHRYKLVEAYKKYKFFRSRSGIQWYKHLKKLLFEKEHIKNNNFLGKRFKKASFKIERIIKKKRLLLLNHWENLLFKRRRRNNKQPLWLRNLNEL